MKTFKKLSEAFEDCLDTQFTYAVNYKNSVSSYFVNATEKNFWNEYMLQGPRNNYEIIRVDRPCHLYLDLDKNNTLYPELDIETVWEEVKQLIVFYFKGLQVDETDLTFIKLSSHSEKKQSLHIIIKVKHKMFRNVLDCGYFMSEIKQRLSPYYSKIVDDAVYTKNRCFRMLGCTKAGQQRYLIGDKPLSYEFWKETKIQPLKWDGSLISFDETNQVSPSTSKYIPEIVYKIFDQLNHDPTFLKLSGKIDIDKVHAIPGSLKFLCNTVSRKCPLAHKTHTTNVTYIHLDLLNSHYCLKCRSKKDKRCNGRTKFYKIMNPLTKTISF